MKKAGLYSLLVVLAAVGLLSVIRALELLFAGGLSSYGAGRVAGQIFLAVLCLSVAWKILARARAA